MSRKKKILCITGCRSEYDILYPVMDTLRKQRDIKVKIVACGTHLSEWHGVTLKKIEEDGFEIADKIDYLLMTNRKTQRPRSIGILTSALAQTVERERPDFLLVVGDREESIAVGIVGNYMDVLVAHIGGGDPVYGNADDPMRFAVSKLAHIHFTFAKKHAENLLKIGEEKFRIFYVGNPAFDHIKSTPRLGIEEISRFLDFDITDQRFIVLIKHPLSSEQSDTYVQMRVTLKALEDFCRKAEYKVIGIYPNSDPGAYDILKMIKSYKNKPFIRFYKTLPSKIFVNLMRNTKALVGNSSMGILEAPFYKLPAVNIGNRQMGRINAGNVEFVSHNEKEIKKALYKACLDSRYRQHVKELKNPYGYGRTSQRIRDLLLSIDTTDNKWYVKKKLC